VLITDSQLVAVSNANKKSNTNGKNGFPGDIMEAFYTVTRESRND